MCCFVSFNPQGVEQVPDNRFEAQLSINSIKQLCLSGLFVKGDTSPGSEILGKSFAELAQFYQGSIRVAGKYCFGSFCQLGKNRVVFAQEIKITSCSFGIFSLDHLHLNPLVTYRFICSGWRLQFNTAPSDTKMAKNTSVLLILLFGYCSQRYSIRAVRFWSVEINTPLLGLRGEGFSVGDSRYTTALG